jgi:hypothetical protein
MDEVIMRHTCNIQMDRCWRQPAEVRGHCLNAKSSRYDAVGRLIGEHDADNHSPTNSTRLMPDRGPTRTGDREPGRQRPPDAMPKGGSMIGTANAHVDKVGPLMAVRSQLATT